MLLPSWSSFLSPAYLPVRQPWGPAPLWGHHGHQGVDFPGSVDPSDQKKTACYDIDVEVEEPLKGQMSSFLLSTANQQEISALDSKVGPHPEPEQGCNSKMARLGQNSAQARRRGTRAFTGRHIQV